MKHSLLDIGDAVTPRSKVAIWVPVFLLLVAGLMLLTIRWNHLPLMLPFMLIIAAPFIRFFISPKHQHSTLRPR